MYCKKCGRPLDPQSTVCHNCGTPVSPDQQNLVPGQTAPRPNFIQAVKLFFSQYLTFGGRSRRSEFWYAQLFQFLGVIAFYLLMILGDSIGSQGVVTFGYLAMILFALAVILPNLAITIRRLHDTGKSGFWYFISMVPFGNIILFIFMVMDSTEDNQWGSNPKQ